MVVSLPITIYIFTPVIILFISYLAAEFSCRQTTIDCFFLNHIHLLFFYVAIAHHAMYNYDIIMCSRLLLQFKKGYIMQRILLIEDDLSLIDGLTYSLKKQGFELYTVRTVREAFAAWADGKYDLLILDLSLPDGSGFDICQRVRQTSKVPVIFLTASDDEMNIVRGLDIGGDDYITKPFKLGVLISRINALLRRARNFDAENTVISSNGITIMLLKGQALKDGKPLDLTAAEYKLLCLLMQNPDVVLSREKILDKLWDGSGNYVDDNTLAVYVRRLRTKIEDDPGDPQMLQTVRRMGYKWKVRA